MRITKLRKRTKCPARMIIVTDNPHPDSEYMLAWHWKFGPGTISPWPSGDYYVDGEYLEPAYCNYQYYQETHGYWEYQEHPPHLRMDIGL